MTDYIELKRLVEQGSLPPVVSALIAENERLNASVKLNLCDYPAIHQGDVDLLVAFVKGASQIELAKVHNCTPPNISRKIRRVKERLGWREGMLVSEIRDRAEQLRALASQGAVVTADLMVERDQLRAEVAGLKTGDQAYEQVNAELKAEVEGLGNELAETELRALKYIHRFAAASDLGREMRVALEAIVALGGSGPEFQIAHDALEPFRTHAAAMGKGEQS